jgi:predicted RNA-binding protein with PUA-like domain
MPSYWILKTEPTTYSYDDLAREKRTRWDGVKNNLALKHIRTMQAGDAVLIYHSGKEKALVGRATVTSKPYADPGAERAIPSWSWSTSRRQVPCRGR